MKRVGRLIEAAASYDSLRLAWLNARRGKSCARSVIAFERSLDRNLDGIADGLLTGTYRWGAFQLFTIYDPKEREIAAPTFRDRVTQHALFNVCGEYFERRQFAESCASRVGRGQRAALEFARCNARRGGWFLKLDVRKYFASIRRDILKGQLSRIFKDQYVLKAFYDFLDAYRPGEERGLPLGALSSQFFANHFLTPLDRLVKCELRVKRYVRYMDDFALWSDDRAELKEALRKIERFLSESLDLSLKEPELKSVDSGMSFLGMRVYPGRLRLGKRARLRFARKYRALTRALEEGEITEHDFATRAQALTAFVAQAESKTFRLRVAADGGRV